MTESITYDEMKREYYITTLVEVLPLLTDAHLCICRDLAMAFARKDKPNELIN